MGKFGFKKTEPDEESSVKSSKSSIFSRSKNNKSPNPATNPYAQSSGPTSAADPYSQTNFNGGYAKAAVGAPAGPQGGNYEDSGSSFKPDSKSAGNASQYGGGYGSDRFGTHDGYGAADRYGGGPSEQEPRSSRYGQGGYGGLGTTTENAAADANREALFGSKAKDSQDPPPYGTNHVESGGSYGANSGTGGYGGSSSYEPLEGNNLTAEEEEEQDVQATKQEIRFIKQADVSSTRNALRAAAMAEETGRNTLGRLGAQGERIHNTEKNLDLTANHNSSAEDKAKELRRLNGSMFAIHPSKPFTASKRREQRDLDVMDRHRRERDEREATRKEAYLSEHRLQGTFKELSLTDTQQAEKKRSGLAERAKYQFEATESDDEIEEELDANIDALSNAATRLNGLAKATGQELDEQNRHLRRLNEKSTVVDDQIAMNRARLDRFK